MFNLTSYLTLRQIEGSYAGIPLQCLLFLLPIHLNQTGCKGTLRKLEKLLTHISASGRYLSPFKIYLSSLSTLYVSSPNQLPSIDLKARLFGLIWTNLLLLVQ